MNTIWKLELNLYQENEQVDREISYFEGKPSVGQIEGNILYLLTNNEEEVDDLWCQHRARQTFETLEDFAYKDDWRITSTLQVVNVGEGEAKNERYINGVLLPQCQLIAPSDGTEVFVPALLSEVGYQRETWANTEVNNQYLKGGWVFLNYMDARKVTEILNMKITGETK